MGHQAYAHKIITGRRDAFKQSQTQRYKVSKCRERIWCLWVGHTSTPISAALGIAVGMQLKGEHNKVVAVIETVHRPEGLHEGLNNAGALKSDILVILNDNQISIDPNGGYAQLSAQNFDSPTYKCIRNRIWKYHRIRKAWRILQFLFSTKAAFKRFLLNQWFRYLSNWRKWQNHDCYLTI